MISPSVRRRPPDIPSLRLIAIVLIAVSTTRGNAADPQPIALNSPLPYGPAPINYFDDEEDNPIRQLQSRLDDGQVTLQTQGDSGYLTDLLRALQINVASQTLVFSRTSLNQALVKPNNPRAIYFNDDVTVGWVPAAAALEIAVQDPKKGTLFYTLAQPTGHPATDPDAPPSFRFHRDSRCTACHISARTLHVPGHVISSFLTDSIGQPHEGYSAINHSTPFKQRWGGWYVTGNAPNLNHWGNLVGQADAFRHRQDPTYRGALDDLASLVDLSRYPSTHSDAVALLVLNHQMHFYNLVNRANFEHRLQRRSDAEERLVTYILMSDEAPLAGPVRGTTKFAEIYQTQGLHDDSGRSLTKLDLQTRLFKFDISPLITSRSFQRLPDEVRRRLYQRIDAELSKRDDPAAREIVRAIIPDWPGHQDQSGSGKP